VGQAYNQNFDTLPDPGTASVNAANPVIINGTTFSLANPFDFAVAPVATGSSGGLGLSALAGWYGLGGLASKFGASDGDQTTGGVISFGLPGNSNRALGLLATSSTSVTAFGAKFINLTGHALNFINLQVTGEVWRQSNLPKSLDFHYWVDPTGTAPFSASAATDLIPSLNVSFPTDAAAVGGLAVDGSAPVNQTGLNVIDQPIASWPPDAALWLVWEMPDATGKSQGLAIDNLRFSASDQPISGFAPSLRVEASGTNLIMSWLSVPGGSYQVEYADDLSAGNWLPLGGPLTGRGGQLTFTNPVSFSNQGFYRLLVAP
jgi:hypothetical protein